MTELDNAWQNYVSPSKKWERLKLPEETRKATLTHKLLVTSFNSLEVSVSTATTKESELLARLEDVAKNLEGLPYKEMKEVVDAINRFLDDKNDPRIAKKVFFIPDLQSPFDDNSMIAVGGKTSGVVAKVSRPGFKRQTGTAAGPSIVELAN